jgi:hypothetical protein
MAWQGRYVMELEEPGDLRWGDPGYEEAWRFLTAGGEEEIFTLLTEVTLNKIELNQIEIRDHPGIKVGTEKYLPMRQSFSPNIQKQEEKVIEIKGKNGKKRGRCCGGNK